MIQAWIIAKIVYKNKYPTKYSTGGLVIHNFDDIPLIALVYW